MRRGAWDVGCSRLECVSGTALGGAADEDAVTASNCSRKVIVRGPTVDNQAGQNRGEGARERVMAVRARFDLVVSDLKPVPRAGEGARCWFQIRHDQHVSG